MTNTNSKTPRVTKAQRFADIKALLESNPVTNGTTIEDAIAFIEGEIKLLARKNAAKNGKQTPTQKANEEFRALIVDFLSAQTEGVTCTQIAKGIPALADFNNQKVSALMRGLTYDPEKNPNGVVSKAVVKGKSLFALR